MGMESYFESSMGSGVGAIAESSRVSTNSAKSSASSGPGTGMGMESYFESSMGSGVGLRLCLRLCLCSDAFAFAPSAPALHPASHDCEFVPNLAAHLYDTGLKSSPNASLCAGTSSHTEHELNSMPLISRVHALTGQWSRHSSLDTPLLTTMHAWRQESFWLEPCETSLLQHSFCAAHAWRHVSKSDISFASSSL